jgi:hypothetical protein
MRLSGPGVAGKEQAPLGWVAQDGANGGLERGKVPLPANVESAELAEVTSEPNPHRG